ELRRSAASVRSSDPNKATAAPRPITPKARSLPTLLPETRPPSIRVPPTRSTAVPRKSTCSISPESSPQRTTSQSLQPIPLQIVISYSQHDIPHSSSLQEETLTALRQGRRKLSNVASEHHF